MWKTLLSPRKPFPLVSSLTVMFLFGLGSSLQCSGCFNGQPPILESISTGKAPESKSCHDWSQMSEASLHPALFINCMFSHPLAFNLWRGARSVLSLWPACFLFGTRCRLMLSEPSMAEPETSRLPLNLGIRAEKVRLDHQSIVFCPPNPQGEKMQIPQK